MKGQEVAVVAHHGLASRLERWLCTEIDDEQMFGCITIEQLLFWRLHRRCQLHEIPLYL